MFDGLDVIIVDDDPVVCRILSEDIKQFYSWGNVLAFSNADKAIAYCRDCEVGLAVFVVDVFLDGKSGFFFLDAIEEKFQTCHEDAIIITGSASDDVVNMCVASDVSYLLEKPVKKYALQLAVRSIVSKYMKFSKKLFQDPDFAKLVAKIKNH
ncbi:Two component system response regulator [Desulfonema limicola]|uniref:Two component system response regulator n=1 Tax=Desulfonema limicola TaxID=45656 RepID=A0A975BCV7_9BACT|nr:response regulator [Desulfonema limicola]QTA82869.1 Two component system response regulator [Desulfonema limicola]